MGAKETPAGKTAAAAASKKAAEDTEVDTARNEVLQRVLSYSGALEQTRAECQRLGLPAFGLHAGRIGMATAAAKGGVDRLVIKGAGGWKSDAVDAYIKVGNAGVQVSDVLLDRW